MVSGTKPLTYQWSKDGVVISDAVASTLQITDADVANAGVYSVVVGNEVGEVNQFYSYCRGVVATKRGGFGPVEGG